MSKLQSKEEIQLSDHIQGSTKHITNSENSSSKKDLNSDMKLNISSDDIDKEFPELDPMELITAVTRV